MAVAGKISDIIGARKAFITFTLLFLTGSILSALAPNVYLLIAARAVQAMGGGGFMPCAAGIVSSTFPENRQRYIGLFSSIFPIGAVIGPNIGGLLVQLYGWRSVFWMNVPLTIGVLILARYLLPPSKGVGSASSIDITGAGLLFGTLSSLMLGITLIGKNISDIPWAMAGPLLGLSLILAVIFFRWEARAKEPRWASFL
jgi:MFS family permease